MANFAREILDENTLGDVFWIIRNEGERRREKMEERKGGKEEGLWRREGRREEGKKARSPAPRTTGNPIIIIIAGESIVALDRIGSVWPGPRIGTRYTATVYRSDGSTMVHRAPFRRCNVQVSS